jgi:hypothetical protein
MTTGGFGNLAWGRHQNGAPSSNIEPRFQLSSPVDGAINVLLDSWIEFYIYCYSSTLSPDDLANSTTISEDAGATYLPAHDSPYSIVVRPYDGQRMWIKIRKSQAWRRNSTIVVGVSQLDEFGNEATKTAVVEWP